MKTFTTTAALQQYLQSLQGKTIGFVPTMGALHQGHLSLIALSLQQTDVTVCSIFVNPTQFNNATDFDKYPRTVAEDAAMLEAEGCHVLYAPENPAEVYDGYTMQTFAFNGLDSVMEGKFRPGHFNGMANVVYRLFDIVKPTKAYFGEKDYQQLAIVQAIVAPHFAGLTIVPCPTTRENDGLAMSSRNRRLSSEGRATAAHIPQILFGTTKQGFTTAAQAKAYAEAEFAKIQGLMLEYFEIADKNSLQPADTLNSHSRIFIAAFVDDVRLIDNIAFSW